MISNHIDAGIETEMEHIVREIDSKTVGIVRLDVKFLHDNINIVDDELLEGDINELREEDISMLDDLSGFLQKKWNSFKSYVENMDKKDLAQYRKDLLRMPDYIMSLIMKEPEKLDEMRYKEYAEADSFDILDYVVDDPLLPEEIPDIIREELEEEFLYISHSMSFTEGFADSDLSKLQKKLDELEEQKEGEEENGTRNALKEFITKGAIIELARSIVSQERVILGLKKELEDLYRKGLNNPVEVVKIGDDESPVSPEDIEKIRQQLANTANDPEKPLVS